MRKRGEWRQRYEQQRQQARSDRPVLEQVCDHESGHCVVIFARGIRVHRVVVARGLYDDSFRQQGLAEWKTVDGEGISLRDKIAIAFGGPCADLHFYGRELDPTGQDHRDAIDAADAIAREQGFGDWHQILSCEKKRAEELVARNAHAIKALSRALLESPRHEMDGETVEAILRREGVQRTGASGNRPTTSSPGRAALPAVPYGFERRAGETRQVRAADADPRRAVAPVFRRTGFIL